MNRIDTQMTLAALVTERPELAPQLEMLELDYCCSGQRRLIDAINEAGLDPTDTVDVLEAVAQEASAADWTGMTMTDLVAHVESTHHVYLREALPRVDALAAKVADVHGESHPELIDVRSAFSELRADLEPHLLKEENVLFPMIRELGSATEAPSFHCGTLQNPIAVMAAEHDSVGELLARLRRLTSGYTVPTDGCASYQALYSGLAELEADTHLHVHKENNELFPQAIAAEAALAAATQ